MVCVSDIVTVTIGPLSPAVWPLEMRMLGVFPELTTAQEADLDTWAEYMAKVQPRGLSTPEEVAAFFTDNVTQQRARPRCADCGSEIDPDWCHCGDAMEEHAGMNHNHSPVPMGCNCYRGL